MKDIWGTKTTEEKEIVKPTSNMVGDSSPYPDQLLNIVTGTRVTRNETDTHIMKTIDSSLTWSITWSDNLDQLGKWVYVNIEDIYRDYDIESGVLPKLSFNIIENEYTSYNTYIDSYNCTIDLNKENDTLDVSIGIHEIFKINWNKTTKYLAFYFNTTATFVDYYFEVKQEEGFTFTYQKDVTYNNLYLTGDELPEVLKENLINILSDSIYGKIQISVDNSVNYIYDIKINRWEGDAEIGEVTEYDLPIIEDDFIGVSNLIYSSTLTKWIRLNSVYNDTNSFGEVTYLFFSDSIETGSGKFRHATIPTQLFSNWLSGHEQNIKNVIMVNETLVGTMLITSITYEYKFKPGERIIGGNYE